MSNQPPLKRPVKEPSFLDAIAPLVLLIVLIGAVYLFGVDAINGPAPVALVICSMVVSLIILKNGYPWEEIAASGGRAISSIVSAIFILLAVGALIGAWNMSGTIPTMVTMAFKCLNRIGSIRQQRSFAVWLPSALAVPGRPSAPLE